MTDSREPTTPAVLLAALLALGLLAGALASPSLAAAKCKKGFARHNGACARKPPKGIPYEGFYGLANSQGKTIFRVYYQGGKWVMFAELQAALPAINCRPSGSSATVPLRTKSLTFPIKPDGSFSWESKLNGATSTGSGKFGGNGTTITISAPMADSDAPPVSGDTCTADPTVSGAFGKASSRDLF